MERQMTEAVTITNEELAILCDIVAGWSVKKAESLDRSKQQVLDRLIANGFVEQANGLSVAKYQRTALKLVGGRGASERKPKSVKAATACSWPRQQKASRIADRGWQLAAAFRIEAVMPCLLANVFDHCILT
jgi:hypothetical protein